MPQPRILIVGAGFGGVAAAIALKRAGFTEITLLEKAARIGGVWRDNTYPGCSCDIPAPLYAYSFAPNPDWSCRYPPRAEILAYLERCVADADLSTAIRFHTEVADARWTGGEWRVRCTDGTEVVADVLIPAMGQLSRPSIPDLPGASAFHGVTTHTARWPADLDVAGKRVAVIGTGASSIQVVPAIADHAAHVTVIQRTPPWTLPKPNRRYGRVRMSIYRRVPGLLRLPRFGTWALTVITGRALVGGRVAHAVVGAASLAQIRLQTRDRALRGQVTPGYRFGCKRVLFSHDWLPTLRRPDVTLVTASAAEITATGVRTSDGRDHRCDIIVYATGFRATEFLAPVRVTGIDGVRLDDAWSGGAFAYLGMTVPGFPNMFLMYGPNTNTGNTSVIYFHESQARYIVQAVRQIADGRLLDVRPDVATSYDAEIQARLATSIWMGCHNWYRAPNGRVVANWPGPAGEYRRRTARLRLDDFQATAMSAAALSQAAESAPDPSASRPAG